MRRVLKYLVQLQNGFGKDSAGEEDIPAGAKIVHAEALSASCWYVWAEVDTNNLPTPVRFVLHGTGHNIEGDESHVATVRIGDYVWHLYKENRNADGGKKF